MDAHAQFNNAPLTQTFRNWVHLPIWFGGHGFQLLTSSIQALYADSLIDSLELRDGASGNCSADFCRRIKRSLMRRFVDLKPERLQPRGSKSGTADLGNFGPEAFFQSLIRPYNLLFQLTQSTEVGIFWEDHLWDAHPNPAEHGAACVLLKARHDSLRSWRLRLPHRPSLIHFKGLLTIWSVMLRRQLDFLV